MSIMLWLMSGRWWELGPSGPSGPAALASHPPGGHRVGAGRRPIPRRQRGAPPPVARHEPAYFMYRTSRTARVFPGVRDLDCLVTRVHVRRSSHIIHIENLYDLMAS